MHNLAFQVQFCPGLLTSLGLPASSFTIHGVEYYGGIGFLKAGLKLADRITTVSPTYALEIQTDEGGMGLGGLLRSRAGVLSGILNGLDDAVWNPAEDPLLPATFSRQNLKPRAKNRAELRAASAWRPKATDRSSGSSASPICSRAGSMRCWCPRARNPAASPSSARSAMGRCPWSRGWAGSPIR